MQSWSTLSPAEQSILRRGMQQSSLAGVVTHYGADLRWAGVAGAPLRSPDEEEQRALVPELAPVLLDLVARGLLVVRMRMGLSAEPTDPVPTEAELREVLAEPDNWIRWQGAEVRFDLDATATARECWAESAFPAELPDGLPDWEGLTIEQREILVCALEASGHLTGPFGILESLPAELAGAELADWVDGQLAPLAEFVRRGWLEVRHFSATSGAPYTVHPLDQLRTAFLDRELRYDEGDEWGVGFTCVFTYAGLAVWRGSGWGEAWERTLTVD